MTKFQTISSAERQQARFNFTMSARDRVLLALGDATYDLGPAEEVIPYMRDFVESITLGRSLDALTQHLYGS